MNGNNVLNAQLWSKYIKWKRDYLCVLCICELMRTQMDGKELLYIDVVCPQVYVL